VRGCQKEAVAWPYGESSKARVEFVPSILGVIHRPKQCRARVTFVFLKAPLSLSVAWAWASPISAAPGSSGLAGAF
jgi:hypothetical protein